MELPSRKKNNGSFIPNDPRYPDQWHLKNSNGEDANVEPAWQLVHGTHNTIIAIVDDGLDIDHEDLSGNVIKDLSIDYNDGDLNPSPVINGVKGDNHGTSVAGIVAAVGGNSVGLTGVAPHAGIVGIRLIGGIQEDGDERTTYANATDALLHKRNDIDIYNNSWGPPDGQYTLPIFIPQSLFLALEEGVNTGRNGKGAIYVFAGGNGNSVNDVDSYSENSNLDPLANSPFTIAVAATNDLGKHSIYSERGANLWVNAPSNDFVSGRRGISTTDRTGVLGYNDSSNYTNSFGGTSASAPLVSGVIALMLEANPNLNWRDVQHILAKSAKKNDSTDSDWVQNAANPPLWVNHKYGFGRVDAYAAVQMASNWSSITQARQVLTFSKLPNRLIPDNDTTGIIDSLTVDSNLTIEYVEVYVKSDHDIWSQLDISVISPSGTRSKLLKQPLIRSNTLYLFPDLNNGWDFGVARLLDESSIGEWQLEIKDVDDHILPHSGREGIGRLLEWRVIVHGVTPDRDQDGVFDNLDNCPAISNPAQTDLDSDGTGDACDVGDFDNDDLSDQEEIQLGTDPSKFDSDNDGIPDGWEVLFSLNPLESNDATLDNDNDGLTNLEEFNMNKNPLINEDVIGILPLLPFLLE